MAYRSELQFYGATGHNYNGAVGQYYSSELQLYGATGHNCGIMVVIYVVADMLYACTHRSKVSFRT